MTKQLLLSFFQADLSTLSSATLPQVSDKETGGDGETKVT